jgi:hypothetical protein
MISRSNSDSLSGGGQTLPTRPETTFVTTFTSALSNVLGISSSVKSFRPKFAAISNGLLIVDGLIAMDTEVCGRVAPELLGCGDLLQPVERAHEELVERHRSWRVLLASRLAHLDADFADRIRPWPLLTQALLRRATRRAADLELQRAIAGHPRLDVRITLCLWNLAGRWGRVEPGGICLRLPLTHRLLGQLVGAERPSVSHALTRLAQAGLVTGQGEEWHLHGTIDSQLDALARRDEPTRSPAVRKLRAVGEDN